jgi:hypothetical protein
LTVGGKLSKQTLLRFFLQLIEVVIAANHTLDAGLVSLCGHCNLIIDGKTVHLLVELLLFKSVADTHKLVPFRLEFTLTLNLDFKSLLVGLLPHHPFKLKCVRVVIRHFY